MTDYVATAKEPSINIRNVILGVIVMSGCIFVGAISSLPHQTEMVTSAINIPLQFTENEDTLSQEEVGVALQSNTAVLNVITDVTFWFKLMVIVGVAGAVFVLMNMCGLVPRYAGMA